MEVERIHFNLGTEEMEVSYCGVVLVVVVCLFGLSGGAWAQWGSGVAGGEFPSKAESVKSLRVFIWIDAHHGPNSFQELASRCHAGQPWQRLGNAVYSLSSRVSTVGPGPGRLGETPVMSL